MKPLRKIEDRWYWAGHVKWDDHPAIIRYKDGKPRRVARWLQLKRFIFNPMSEQEKFDTAWDEYLDYMAEGPEEQ